MPDPEKPTNSRSFSEDMVDFVKKLFNPVPYTPVPQSKPEPNKTYSSTLIRNMIESEIYYYRSKACTVGITKSEAAGCRHAMLVLSKLMDRFPNE